MFEEESRETAAASALEGAIVDASGVSIGPLRPAAPLDPGIPDLHIAGVVPEAKRGSIEIERGPNLVPPPPADPLPAEVDARVLIVTGDDISTGDIAPDGVIAMSVWSNIGVCAKFMFRRLDPEFRDRASEWGGGIIVSGGNYGQGSSREHAALIPLYLGVRVVAACSCTRIHRRNLIAAGIVPLVLPNEADRFVGQRWVIPALCSALAAGDTSVTADVDGGTRLTLGLDFSPGEREILSTGGLLAHVSTGGRPLLRHDDDPVYGEASAPQSRPKPRSRHRP